MENLLIKIRKISNGEPIVFNIDDFRNYFELMTSFSIRDNNFHEELEIMAMEDIIIKIQLNLTDLEKEMWIKIADRVFEYGHGNIENPTVVLSGKREVMGKILSGKSDIIESEMMDELTLTGSHDDAMAFQELIQLTLFEVS